MHCLSDNQELALALLLWKCYRQKAFPDRRTGPQLVRAERCLSGKNLDFNLDIAGEAAKMARVLGVHKEFLDMVMAFPVMNVQFLERDPWESSSISSVLSKGSTPGTDGKRVGSRKKKPASPKKKK